MSVWNSMFLFHGNSFLDGYRKNSQLNFCLWTQHSTGFGKTLFNFPSPNLCFRYKYDNARYGSGVNASHKTFHNSDSLLCQNAQLPEGHIRVTRLRDCFALWSLCCQPFAAVIKLLLFECVSGQIFVISQTGSCGRPALLTRSLLWGRQTRRVIPRGSLSGSNHLSLNFSQPGIALPSL